MVEINWQEVIQALGAISAAAVVGLAAKVKFGSTDGKPPIERRPAPDEMRKALADLQSRIDSLTMDEGSVKALRMAVSSLIDIMEQHRKTLDRNTNAATLIADRMNAVTDAIEELAKEMEISSRLNGRSRR